MAEETERVDPERPEGSGQTSEERSKPKSVYVAATFMGLVIGFFSMWATLNMGAVAAFAFFLGTGLSIWYLAKKPLASAVLGTGCYITAVVMVLTPLLFYIPNLWSDPTGTEEIGTFIGSALGILLWGFVFTLFAGVTAVIGYFLRRRADRKLSGG